MHQTPLQNSAKIDILLCDSFLAQGMKLILEDTMCQFDCKYLITVFDATHFFEAIQNLSNIHIGIMVCDNHSHNYLPTQGNIFRITSLQSISDMKNLVSNIICGATNAEQPVSPRLNNKEIAFIELIKKDFNPSQISHHLGVTLKTVYAVRQRLAGKLACASFQELHYLCNTSVFSNWYYSQLKSLDSAQ